MRAVIFDLGHTIIDFGPAEDALRDTYARVLDMLAGMARAECPSIETMIEAVTRRIDALIGASYAREELEEIDIVALFEAALRDLGFHVDRNTARQIALLEHRALAVGTVLPPENRAAVRQIKERGLKLGLVSNVSFLPEFMREDLERLDLLRYFDVTIFSSEEGIRKPHPRIYDMVLARLQMSPSDAVFVGDRLREDVQGPKQAGMRAVLTRQFRQEDPDQSPVAPDAVIASLTELPAIVDRWRRTHPSGDG